MKEKKRIETLQKIVNRLQAENQQLIKENVRLQEDLDFEKARQKGSQNTQKLLENELQKCIGEYKKLNSRYKEESEKLRKLRNEYSKKMNKIIKSIKITKGV